MKGLSGQAGDLPNYRLIRIHLVVVSLIIFSCKSIGPKNGQ